MNFLSQLVDMGKKADDHVRGLSVAFEMAQAFQRTQESSEQRLQIVSQRQAPGGAASGSGGHSELIQNLQSLLKENERTTPADSLEGQLKALLKEASQSPKEKRQADLESQVKRMDGMLQEMKNSP